VFQSLDQAGDGPVKRYLGSCHTAEQSDGAAARQMPASPATPRDRSTQRAE